MITDFRTKTKSGWNPIYKRKIELDDNIPEISIKGLDLSKDIAYKLEWELQLPRQDGSALIYLEPNNQRNKWRVLWDGVLGYPFTDDKAGIDSSSIAICNASTVQAPGTKEPSAGHFIFTGHHNTNYYWSAYGEVILDDGNRLSRKNYGAQIVQTLGNLTYLNIHAQKNGNTDVAFKGNILLSRLDL